ncbi:MAG: hypothetical protein NTW65_04465 [Deltaproteobacteria bacterium]|nr:hypothetical protein [Deltaproteobacteria bacterium]
MKRNLIFALLFGVVLIFYLWTASSNWVPFHFNLSETPQSYRGFYDGQGYHDLLADAFLHGQLSLLIEPRPELLALDDPYDPVANARYRLHDASLYKGKYFFYFTPVVALLFIAPFKAMTGYFVSEALLTVLFCFAGFVFSYLTLLKILRIGKVPASLPVLLTSALVLATVNMVPFLLRRTSVYELCIAAAYAFMMAGTYFLIGAMSSQRRDLWAQIVLAGILLGLCIVSRPNQLFACGLMIIAFIVIRYHLLHEKAKTVIKNVGFLITPIVVIGMALCWYNYARFGSIFEFGFSYQLSGIHPHRDALTAWIYIPLGLYHNILQPIPFDLRFPFFHIAAPVAPFDIPSVFKYNYEKTIGLLSLPVYWLLSAPLFCLRSIWKTSSTFLLISLFMIAASLATLFLASKMPGTTIRFIVDFSPLLLLATIALFLAARPLIFNSQSPGPTISRWSFYVPTLISILISISISMTGYYDNLKIGNPQLYQNLEHIFSINISELTNHFYPAPKIPPDVPSAKLRIDTIYNQNGLERDPSNVQFFWLGNGETEIELFSIKAGMAQFTAGAYPGPSLPESNQRRIRISSGSYVQELTINGAQEAFAFTVPIQAGKNVVRLLPHDTPTVFINLPNGDVRVLLVMFRNLRLVKVTD